MKQFIYVLFDKDRAVVAMYEREDVMKTLLPHIEKFTGSLTIEKCLKNPDIKVVKENYDRNHSQDEPAEDRDQ